MLVSKQSYIKRKTLYQVYASIHRIQSLKAFKHMITNKIPIHFY